MRIFITLCLLGLVTLASGQKWNEFSVIYGQHTSELPQPEAHVFRIFMDKNGFFYPSVQLPDALLKSKGSSISNLLSSNDSLREQVAIQYKLDPKTATVPNIKESIIASISKELEQKTKEYESSFFMIHGFRKKAYGEKENSLSSTDYLTLEREIQSTQKEKALFIEIYWDGTHISPIKAYKYRGFKLMERNALPQAKNAGYALRQLISNLNIDTLNIVSHSLGAVVANELLFNTREQQTFPTPSQSVVNNIYIAPAIGFEAFLDFHDRNTEINFTEHDNYNLSVVYNPTDFVLLKSFHFKFINLDVEPTKYGNTSLGCDYNNDILKFNDLFKYKYPNTPKPRVLMVDDSIGWKAFCHLIRCYCSSPAFQNAFL
ncbi:MAG: hypothetical protein ACJAY8_000421 [Sphingobacteriales bacterium]|jgi:hypothetical protein